MHLVILVDLLWQEEKPRANLQCFSGLTCIGSVLGKIKALGKSHITKETSKNIQTKNLFYL